MDTDKWDAIKDQVKSGGGVATVLAGDLRRAVGAGRLTVWINQQIIEALNNMGYETVPATPELMPLSQWDEVRVYDASTPIGKVIRAALRPGTTSDDVLRESVAGGADEILSQIRLLVATE